MTDLNLSPLITDEQLEKKIAEIGQSLTKKFNGENLIAICILRGSFMFFSDLVRQIDADIFCEFFGISSYGDSTQSSGEVKVTLDLTTPIENKNILLIEDIVDTGLTMNFLKETLQARKPKSLTTVSLLYKPKAIKQPCQIDYVGFEIPNNFVVGYGLDYQGFYRNLPYIAQVTNLN